MLRSNQRLCLWCGPVGIVFWLAGFWVFGDFVPPPSPTDDPAEVTSLYEENRDSIRIGLILASFGGALFMPYFAVISVQLRRIEGRYSPLAWTQLGLASATCLGFIIPMMVLQVAAFREGRSPDDVQLFHDMGWVWFIGYVSVGVIQWSVIGLAILRDDRAEPILPRWSGYLSLWTALLFVPGCLCVFFKTGPLAWDGVFTWWIPAIVFSLWISGMTPVLLRAIGTQEPERVEPADGRVDLAALLAETAALRAEVADLRQQIGASTGD